ncbi:MAG: lipocalin family protein [Bacteroidota bacterium]
MKIKNLFFGLLILLSASACNSDDDSMTGNDSEIVGTWTMTAFSYTGNSSSTTFGQTTSTDFNGVGRDITMQLEFKSDGTYTSSGSYIIDLSFGIIGQSITVPITFQGFMGNGTYVVDGDQITATNSDNETGTSTIIKLEGDDLELASSQDETIIDQGSTVDYTIDGDFIFRRQ